MVKIGLCFSGHPRTFEAAFVSIKSQILDKFDCDIFISTYFINENISDRLVELYKPKKINVHNEQNIIEVNEKYLNTLPLIKTLSIDVKNDCKSEVYFDYQAVPKNFFQGRIYNHVMSQFYGICDAAKLCKEYMVEHGVEYNYIMRLRLDDQIIGNFEINEMKEDNVMINSFLNYSHSIKAHDHFFMAHPEMFFKVAMLYDNLLQIIGYVNDNDCWVPISGYQETFLLLQILLIGGRIEESKDKYTIEKLF